MGHKCIFIDKIEVDNMGVYRSVIAEWNGYSEEVQKHYLNGDIFESNHLEFTMMGGYTVFFTGEKVKRRYYYYEGTQEIIEKPKFYEVNKLSNPWVKKSITDDELILKYNPELKYLIVKARKFTINNQLLFQLIGQYKKYPNIEPLVERGLFSIALNNRLQKFTKKKLNQVIHFIKSNEDLSEQISLQKILSCIKYKVSWKEIDQFKECYYNVELFTYLKNKNTTIRYYRDYLVMLKKTDHSENDVYWKYPNNLQEAHDKLMNEIKAIDDAKKVEKDLFLKKATKNILKNHRRI